MPSGEFFPAGIPHSSLSPPGNPRKKKLGVGEVPFTLDSQLCFSYIQLTPKRLYINGYLAYQ
jgi:hypothetical protein